LRVRRYLDEQKFATKRPGKMTLFSRDCRQSLGRKGTVELRMGAGGKKEIVPSAANAMKGSIWRVKTTSLRGCQQGKINAVYARKDNPSPRKLDQAGLPVGCVGNDIVRGISLS